jgi:hypothetical protein
MAQIDNLAQGSLDDIFRRIRALEFATNQNNMAIGRDGLSVYDGGVITIENGGLKVTGTAEIIGRLLASGIIDFTGDVNITGPLDVSGLTTLMSDLTVASGGRIIAGTIELNPDGSAKFGTMTISPAGKITSGAAEINPDGSAKFGNTTVSSAGVIKSGNTLIDPSSSNGGFTFVSGGGVGGDAGAVLLRGSSNAGVLATDNASLFAGASSVDVRPDGVYVPGLPTTTEPANLYANASGKLFRSTA